MDSHELIASWVRHLRALNYSEHTITTYTRPVHYFLTWRVMNGLGGLCDTTPDEVDAFLETLGSHGPAKSSYAQALRHLFGYLTRRSIFTTNPTLDCRPRMAPPEPPDSYTREELLALLGTAFSHSPRQAWSLALCYYTGTRRSEVTGMRLADIVGDEIEVRGKGSKTRYIPLNPQAQLAIEHLAPWSNGTILGIKPQTFTMWAYRNAIRTGFPEHRRNAHLLRATCAAHLEEAGVPASAIRDFLGHANLATTNRYLRRRRRQELREAALMLR